MSFSKYKRPEYAPHRAALEDWQVSIKEAKERDYSFLTADSMQRETGIASNAIRMPTAGIDGRSTPLIRYRLLDEAVIKAMGGKRKYHQRANTGYRPHFGRLPKAVKRKWTRRKYSTVWMTEGERKADKAAERGIYCISVPGVSCWRDPLDKSKLHPDLRTVIDGRKRRKLKLRFAYDTDQNTKPQVWREQLALADAARAYAKEIGCKLKIEFLSLPPVPNVAKTGLDDALLHYGDAAIREAPCHDIDSPFVNDWREKVGATKEVLPEALRTSQTFDPSWLDEPPPPVDWIVPNYLQTLELGAMLGQASTGKSTLLLQLTASIGAGLDIGFGKTKTRKVMYLMLERHERSMRRRWHKIANTLAATLKPSARQRFDEAIRQNCFLRPLAGQAIDLVEHKNNEWTVREEFVDHVITMLKDLGIELVIFDPLSRLSGGDENDNSRGAAITKACERIMEGAACSVLLVHHIGKSDRVDMYAGRGASSITDNTSECYVMELLDKKHGLQINEQYKDWEIVKLHHARASDGREEKPAYLARNPNDGTLVRITAEPLESGDMVTQMTDAECSICEWAAKNPTFTQTRFVDARSIIFPGLEVSRVDAKEVWESALAQDVFIPSLDDKGNPLKDRNGRLYTLNPSLVQSPSEPTVSRGTERLKLNGKKGGKRDAQKHA